MATEFRSATQFAREFKAFLAGIGYKLHDFLPDDTVDEPMFPDCSIPRSTGYERLRGQGRLLEELALLWGRRSQCFLADAIKNGKTVHLDGISFIDYVDGHPQVNWKQLIFLYDMERLDPIRIKKDDLKEMKPTTPTRFNREFKSFLAGIGFRLKHFLPDDTADDPMFPDCLIPRATGYERLRGQGRLTEELAILWARRCQLFLADAIRSGKKLWLDDISFIDYECGKPVVNARKLVFLYQTERLVPLRIKIDASLDDSTVTQMLAALRAVAGNVQIVLARVRESSTEITVLVSPEAADEIISLFARREVLGTTVEVEESSIPPEGTIAGSLLLDGPAIDLARPDALGNFGKVWQRAVLIESAVRPWRRLRWLFSPSIGFAPYAQTISASNDRAYAANDRGTWSALKADIRMTCITWPLFAACVLGIALLALHPVFPLISIGAGVGTGLAVSLAGSQICSAALSPIACGAGTIVMCWAFGLAQAFAIGAIGSVGILARSDIQNDFFISVTGGIIGLAAPIWRSRMALPIIAFLLITVAGAIAVAGWLMAQPAKAGGPSQASRKRLALGSLAGSAMGAGIGLVHLFSTVLMRFGYQQQIAFIVAFTVLGSVCFAFTLRLRMPQLRVARTVIFTVSYALVVSSLCIWAYEMAGSSMGLLALAASTGCYQATWFTAASVVGNRIGSARAAVIATTIEGAVGFTAFIVFRLIHG